MKEVKTLASILDSTEEAIGLNVEIPNAVVTNLAATIELRPYQVRAIERIVFYREAYRQRVDPNHLLFHMATGSGKTIIMAAAILYLYKKGHRDFLFFVNSSQIVEKTKANFLHFGASKYLFAPQIRINDKIVDVREVDTFEESATEAINIHFTTIQGLHSRITEPRENSLTLEDFEDRRIVLISDEAHHLNVATKSKLKVSEEEERTSWEGTVSKIFGANPNNVLLEFTATANLEHPAILAKYCDKILFDYRLREFRNDGYSKDVELRQADLSPVERMLQAVVLSQYRRKVAEAHGVQCKPVILMKSKTIAASKENETRFHRLISSLDGEALESLRTRSKGDDLLTNAFDYVFEERRIAPIDFAAELKVDFAKEKVANVNRPADLEQRQIELNSLEDHDNELRVVFAVDKLNEGWDVLNLFDIVRLYDTRDSRKNKVGRTTTQEAQLIGRGARYFPFRLSDMPHAPRAKRKFDDCTDHPLRIIEQLHYHCSHNPKYIQDIRRALRDSGMIDETARTVDLKVKSTFKETPLYTSGHIWLNERKKASRETADRLTYYVDRKEYSYPRLLTGRTSQVSAFGGTANSDSRPAQEPVTRTVKLSELGEPVVRFALDSNEFFHFARLRRYFPQLRSLRDFIQGKEFLASVSVRVTGLKQDVERLATRQQIQIAQFVLRQIESGVKSESIEYTGSREFYPHSVKAIVVDKKLKVSVQGERGRSWAESEMQGLSMIDLQSKDWYVYDDSYGTEQEKEFIRFMHESSDRLKDAYDSFYLVRNEKLLQIYTFDDGRAFEPDFVMFLQQKGEESSDILQVFIEPKGEYLIKEDEWKEDFLKQLKNEAKIQTLFQGRDYAVYGLPFFNSGRAHKRAFEQQFTELIFGRLDA